MKFPVEVEIPARVELHCRSGEETCEWFKTRHQPFRRGIEWLDIEYALCFHPSRDAKPCISMNGSDLTPDWCPLLKGTP